MSWTAVRRTFVAMLVWRGGRWVAGTHGARTPGLLPYRPIVAHHSAAIDQLDPLLAERS